MPSRVVLAVTADQAAFLVERISKGTYSWDERHYRTVTALRDRGLMEQRSIRGRILTTAGVHLAHALRALGLHR